MKLCNIVSLAVGLAHGINARPMRANFEFPDAENHCFARCMSSEKECRQVPGANLSRCASDLAICKPSCSWRTATSNSTYTSTSMSTGTSTSTSISTSSTCTGTPTSTATPDTDINPQSATVATPTPSAVVPSDVRNICHDQCQAIHAKCIAGRGANVANCESNLKVCTWLCPLDGLRQSE